MPAPSPGIVQSGMMHGSHQVLRKGKDLPRKTPALGGREAAEHVAIQALSFIAGDGERLGGFLAATGMGPAAIRDAARDPQFLAGVLDYVAGNEPLLVDFAKHADLPPETIMIAVQALGGAASHTNWP